MTVLTQWCLVSALCLLISGTTSDCFRSRQRGDFITGSLIEGDRKSSASSFAIPLGPGQQVAGYFFQSAPVPEVFKGSAVLTALG